MADPNRKCPACNGVVIQETADACVYCGTNLGGQGIEGESAHAPRLAKMSDHDQFPAAQAWDPPGDLQSEANARIRAGAILLIVGGALVSLASSFLSFWGLLGVAAIVWGGLKLVKGFGERSKVLAHSLVKRPAVVTDRRSETAFNGWSGRVTYFFTMEFEDGRQGEFRFPGRGWPHEPLARGATGLAYTRGPELLEFKNIKV